MSTHAPTADLAAHDLATLAVCTGTVDLIRTHAAICKNSRKCKSAQGGGGHRGRAPSRAMSQPLPPRTSTPTPITATPTTTAIISALASASASAYDRHTDSVTVTVAATDTDSDTGTATATAAIVTRRRSRHSYPLIPTDTTATVHRRPSTSCSDLNEIMSQSKRLFLGYWCIQVGQDKASKDQVSMCVQAFLLQFWLHDRQEFAEV